MAEFNIKPKNQLEINKKPRVYFTCHHEDFEKYFDKICEDFFKTHDCAIYYTEDMTEVIEEDEKEVDLGRNNLFVVPVTYKLLSTSSRAMDEDIPYALNHHIPILPIMMESGLDTLYSKNDKIGDLQYINPFSKDFTEISYETKLKKYLESVLISDEMAKLIRAAFDTHVFLSYRKKDRKFANELMRLVHSNPACRDIAIWFDEFLTPGENFKDNIDKMLKDSKLFTLLVTPNLLEEPDGKPNFVMGKEFPAARDLGMKIIPAEMVETDKCALSDKFKGIPDCVNPADEAFCSLFINSMEKIAIDSNDSPAHKFLIGLAYLDGIDVEVNREFALELIISAAEAGFHEACFKLYKMYNNGIGVALNYRNAIIWAEKYLEHLVTEYGDKDHKTIWFINELSITYINAGEYQEALKKLEKQYTLCCELYGEDNKEALSILNNIAIVFMNLKNYSKALQYCKKAYELQCKLFGEEDSTSVLMLNNLSCVYCALRQYEEALPICEKAYTLHCKLFGEKHPETLTCLNNLSAIFYSVGKYQEAFEHIKKVYTYRCDVLGEKHPHTILSLSNLGNTYSKLHQFENGIECNDRAYKLHCEVLGEEHPTTLSVLNNLAEGFIVADKITEARECFEKVYELGLKVLGDKHHEVYKALNHLMSIFEQMNEYSEKIQQYEKLYNLTYAVLGAKNITTLTVFNKLTNVLCDAGQYQKAIENYELLYDLCCDVFGVEDQKTMVTLYDITTAYLDAGNFQKALENHEKLYELKCKVLGEKHPEIIKTLKEIIEISMKAENKSKAISTISILASIYCEKGAYQKAFPYFKKALDLCKETLGEEHPYTIASWYNMSYCYAKLGDIVNALLISEQIHDSCIRVLGAEHSITIKNNLQIEEIKKILAETNQEVGDSSVDDINTGDSKNIEEKKNVFSKLMKHFFKK